MKVKPMPNSTKKTKRITSPQGAYDAGYAGFSVSLKPEQVARIRLRLSSSNAALKAAIDTAKARKRVRRKVKPKKLEAEAKDELKRFRNVMRYLPRQRIAMPSVYGFYRGDEKALHEMTETAREDAYLPVELQKHLSFSLGPREVTVPLEYARPFREPTNRPVIPDKYAFKFKANNPRSQRESRRELLGIWRRNQRGKGWTP